MLPFSSMSKDLPVEKGQPPKGKMIANRFLCWLYELYTGRHGFTNGYVPEYKVTSALAGKSLQHKEHEDWDAPLWGTRYIIFDTETTGFYPFHGDEIINIGAVVVEDGKVHEDLIFDELVNPYRAIPAAIQKLTGITDEMVADRRGICDVLSDFLGFIDDSVLVAHNAAFDLAFINIKLNSKSTELHNPVIDTHKLSIALCPEFISHDLDTLIRNLRIPMRSRHTARGDSLMTAEIFLEFLDRLHEKDINTLKQLYSYLHQIKK